MISTEEMRKTVKSHLKDSVILFKNTRYNGSIYLCGYAVEIALKLRICKTLHWPRFPENNKEFTYLTSLKTHNLDVLLQLSGKEKNIKTHHFVDWSLIARWDPEVRYKAISNAKRNDAMQMITSSKNILVALGIKV